MERRKTERFDSLIGTFLRENCLEGPLMEYRCLQAWDEVVGAQIASATTQKRIENQTFCVSLRSPAMRHTLLMRRGEIVRKLNEKSGGMVVMDLRIN